MSLDRGGLEGWRELRFAICKNFLKKSIFFLTLNLLFYTLLL